MRDHWVLRNLSAVAAGLAAGLSVHRVLYVLQSLGTTATRFEPAESALLVGMLVALAVWAFGAFLSRTLGEGKPRDADGNKSRTEDDAKVGT